MSGQSDGSAGEGGDGAQSVHILGGLPTEGVACGFDRIREVFPVLSFAAFAGTELDEWAQTGVLLPPHTEPSQLVEGWEECGYLAERFGRGAHIGSVTTLVDSSCLWDQLNSPEPISARGWGKNARDIRSVADIAVGQIESATHLLLVGGGLACKAIGRLLEVLNPGAAKLELAKRSDAELRDFLTRPRQAAGDPFASSASVRRVPPWLDLLQSESVAPRSSDGFLYRRSRPFDPERFGDWLADPPRELVRGKGTVWFANRCDESLGYSCAGSVHRVFVSGRWWVSRGTSMWPTCEVARRRLFERWHPHFGDRRQEIAFAGIDLDADQICSHLDGCLLSEEEAIEVVSAPGRVAGRHADDSPRVGLH